ncbi:MAG: cation transporter [Bacteriovoracaceae bacterium]|nr:cation transporter [Bacteriovoracaceae bacterium]
MNISDEKCNIITRVTWASVVTNLVLAIIKFVFGILGRSHAVVADAVHSLSDLTTDFAILIGVRFWSKPPDEDHPHGHYKIETMVTFFIGLVLGITATGILYNSIVSIHSGTYEKPRIIALVAAIISIITKEILFRWTIKKGRVLRCMPVIANAHHQRSDAISSIPVAAAVLFSVIFPDWSFVDHIGAIIVAFLIYQAAFKIMNPAINKLADRGVSAEELKKIYEIAGSIDGVKGIHDVRTRYIGSANVATDLHIEVDAGISVQAAHDIYQQVKDKLLESNLSIVDIVIHIDPYHG